ncbi:hypothetical protein ACKWTF_015023 [Chironomus riparius]
MKIFAISMLFLFCVVNLKHAASFKCEFDYLGYYSCNLISDLSSIEDKHDISKTDDDVEKIQFEGDNNEDLIQLDLSPICQRFKNVNNVLINKIELINEKSFRECKNLKILWISYLKMEEIPENLFSNQSILTEIGVSRSNLTTLPENVFFHQTELQRLYLDGNQITCLPLNIFKPLAKLSWLDLGSNKIQLLHPKWFENLQSLNSLDLSDNKIQDLPKNVFTNLINLEYLHLSANQLTTIHSDSFGIYRNLIFIDLSNNNVSAIDEKLISNPVANLIDMRGNVCIDSYIITDDDTIEDLSNCYENYQPNEQPRVAATVSIVIIRRVWLSRTSFKYFGV